MNLKGDLTLLPRSGRRESVFLVAKFSRTARSDLEETEIGTFGGYELSGTSSRLWWYLQDVISLTAVPC